MRTAIRNDAVGVEEEVGIRGAKTLDMQGKKSVDYLPDFPSACFNMPYGRLQHGHTGSPRSFMPIDDKSRAFFLFTKGGLYGWQQRE